MFKYLSMFVINMRTWALHYNGLEAGIPDVIWKFVGEENLYLVMRPPYLRSPMVSYSMVRCPVGEEWNPRSVKSVIFLEDKTAVEFQEAFHEISPHFPLPQDIQEKYDAIVRTQLNFLRKMGLNPPI